jgi:ABC-type polysaccharide/polyol phosphate export permease
MANFSSWADPHADSQVPEAGVIQDAATIWKFRYFWMSLVKMDLMTRYRKSVLGIFWSLLHPIVMTIIFCLVFHKLNGAIWDSFAKYLLCGMAAYGFLRDCTLTGCHTLARHEGYIRQTPLPYPLYSLRVMLSTAVHFLITLVVVVLLVAVLPPARLDDQGRPPGGGVTPRAAATATATAAGTPAPNAPSEANPPSGLFERVAQGDWGVFGRLWMVLPAIVLAMVCGWALATVTAFATVYFHDIAHLLELFAQFLFFVTPIMWFPHVVVPPGYDWLVTYNPASAFVDLFRLPLVFDRPPSETAVWVAVGATALAVVLAAVLNTRLSKRVIFQM